MSFNSLYRGSMINSYKDLHIWQKGLKFCEKIYQVTKKFPTTEIYGLTSQIRRCSISIPSNIAEGNARGHITEYKQFLRVAFGSAAELETQLILAERIGYLTNEDFKKLNTNLEEIKKMLYSLIKSLSHP